MDVGINHRATHPLYNLLSRVKESSKRLRTQTSQLPLRFNYSESYKKIVFFIILQLFNC